MSNLAQLVALHMGALHRYEWALLGLVAFGPFVVLFIVVYVVRRRDLSEHGRPHRGGPEG